MSRVKISIDISDNGNGSVRGGCPTTIIVVCIVVYSLAGFDRLAEIGEFASTWVVPVSEDVVESLSFRMDSTHISHV